MRLAYSYVRFSSPEQAKGNSLERQDTKNESWAKRENWTYDKSLSIRDLGRSAFKKGQQLGLYGFIAAIKEGKVPTGSVLIVERLDRLSRANLDDAYQLFRTIILAGVDIADSTTGTVYTKDSLNSPWQIMQALVAFALANEESAKKAERTQVNWAIKRKGLLLSNRCPTWLTIQGEKYVADKIKVATIRQIFTWSIEGKGAPEIVKILNKQGIQNIAYGSKVNCRTSWNQRMVEALLQNRQLLGERQHFRMVDGKRVPEGSPRNEFPQVISEEIFYAAQAARKSRATQRGPRGEKVANIFQGILFDAESGSPMRLMNSSPQDKRKGIHRRITTYNPATARWGLGWAYGEFERYFLRTLKEITAEQLLSQQPKINPIPGLVEKLDQINQQIERVQEQIVEGGSVDSLAAVLRKLDARQKTAQGELEAAKQAEQTESTRSCNELGTVIDALAKAKGDEQIRLRDKLKALLRLLVNEIWVSIDTVGGNRLNRVLVCQIFLNDDWHREFALYSKRGELLQYLNCGKSPDPESLVAPGLDDGEIAEVVSMVGIDLAQHVEKHLKRKRYDLRKQAV